MSLCAADMQGPFTKCNTEQIFDTQNNDFNVTQSTAPKITSYFNHCTNMLPYNLVYIYIYFLNIQNYSSNTVNSYVKSPFSLSTICNIGGGGGGGLIAIDG